MVRLVCDLCAMTVVVCFAFFGKQIMSSFVT